MRMALFLSIILVGCLPSAAPVPDLAMAPDLAPVAAADMSVVRDMASIPDMFRDAGKPPGATCAYSPNCPSAECSTPKNPPASAHGIESCCDLPYGESLPDGDEPDDGGIKGVCCWYMFIVADGIDLQCKDCGDGYVCKPV